MQEEVVLNAMTKTVQELETRVESLEAKKMLLRQRNE